MGVTSLGCHTRPACTQDFTRFIKTMPRMWIQLLCVRVLYSMGSRGLKQWLWRHISHMGEMRDSDWSRENLLRSDWSGPYCSHHHYSQEKETRVKFNPGLSANPSSNNWPQSGNWRRGLRIESTRSCATNRHARLRAKRIQFLEMFFP